MHQRTRDRRGRRGDRRRRWNPGNWLRDGGCKCRRDGHRRGSRNFRRYRNGRRDRHRRCERRDWDGRRGRNRWGGRERKRGRQRLDRNGRLRGNGRRRRLQSVVAASGLRKTGLGRRHRRLALSPDGTAAAMAGTSVQALFDVATTFVTRTFIGLTNDATSVVSPRTEPRSRPARSSRATPLAARASRFGTGPMGPSSGRDQVVRACMALPYSPTGNCWRSPGTTRP